MKIGYLAQVFPSLTMTFVYREVRAMRAVGLEIETFSTWKPELDELSTEARDLVQDTFYVFPINWLQFLLVHARYLLTRPRRYLGALGYLMTRKHKTVKNRLRTLFHFCEAIYMAKEVERKNIRHMHVHFALNAATMAMVIERLTDVPFSFTAHANDIFANPILLPEKIKAARFIIAISEYNKRFLHELVPGLETLAKIQVVRCGVDTQVFAPPESRPQNERPIILDVARLVEKKGHPYLIKACKLLVEQGYDFRCLIAGGGPQESLLKQMIREESLSDYVELLGVVFQEQLRDLLARADIFALPCVEASDQDKDGLPVTLMEAMAMGVPVISTTVTGIPELIIDMETGLLVPPRDEISLAGAIATLFENRKLRSTLGAAGRARVLEEFAIDKNANRLLNVFVKYLENGSRP